MVEKSRKEIRKYFDKIYSEYVHSPERAKNVDALRRKHYNITPEELVRPFTV